MTTLRIPRSLLGLSGATEHKAGGRPLVLIRGGGDLATGTAARLFRCGFAVVVTEIPFPLAVRRLVSLAEAVYAAEVHIEELRGLLVNEAGAVEAAVHTGVIPVLVDPDADCREVLQPAALVDGRMLKQPSGLGLEAAPMVIGLGPGFVAGKDVHAVVETNRGHRMGRVVWRGSAEADTAQPEKVMGFDVERVLRAPVSGSVRGLRPLATVVRKGDPIAVVGEAQVLAPIDGTLRGLVHDGVWVEADAKIGDLDPRAEPAHCYEISDKALAVGGGVLEALLSRAENRRLLGG